MSGKGNNLLSIGSPVVVGIQKKMENHGRWVQKGKIWKLSLPTSIHDGMGR